jgi:UDP-glucose 4-epimerase
MTILIVGGAGYIGSVVVEELLKSGYETVVVDNLSTGHRDAVDAGIPFYDCGCGDFSRMRGVFDNHDFDVVMHFAAFSLVQESVKNPTIYFQNNIADTISLLSIMKEYACFKFILSSTAAIFGEPQYTPIDENHPKNPINPYGYSKFVLENILQWYHRSYGLQYNSFRYFNAAGASEEHGERHKNETHIIPLLIESAVENKEFTIFGDDYDTTDGTCIRDYIHVLDLADAHIRGIHNLEKQADGCYNLGNGSGFSNKQVADTVKAVSAKDILIKVGPRRSGDPAVLVASAEKAKHELGWQRKFPELSAIVESAYKFYFKKKDKE